MKGQTISIPFKDKTNMADKKKEKKEKKDTDSKKFKFLKRGDRWNSVLGKMSKPGEKPQPVTKKPVPQSRVQLPKSRSPQNNKVGEVQIFVKPKPIKKPSRPTMERKDFESTTGSLSSTVSIRHEDTYYTNPQPERETETFETHEVDYSKYFQQKGKQGDLLRNQDHADLGTTLRNPQYDDSEDDDFSYEAAPLHLPNQQQKVTNYYSENESDGNYRQKSSYSSEGEEGNEQYSQEDEDVDFKPPQMRNSAHMPKSQNAYDIYEDDDDWNEENDENPVDDLYEDDETQEVVVRQPNFIPPQDLYEEEKPSTAPQRHPYHANQPTFSPKHDESRPDRQRQQYSERNDQYPPRNHSQPQNYEQVNVEAKKRQSMSRNNAQPRRSNHNNYMPPPQQQHSDQYFKPSENNDIYEEDEDENLPSEDAPVSSLVNQYFYQKPQKVSKKAKVRKRLQKKKEEDQRKQDIETLQKEMQYFKSENTRLRKDRENVANEKQRLNTERLEFERYMEQERKKLEEWKQNEWSKIKKQQRIVERQSRANAQHLSRREQEKEIKFLKEQLHSQSTQSKQHALKLKAEIDRLKAKCKELKEERNDLKEDLRRRELKRIDTEFDGQEQVNWPQNVPLHGGPQHKPNQGKKKVNEPMVEEKVIYDDEKTTTTETKTQGNESIRQHLRSLKLQYPMPRNPPIAPPELRKDAKPVSVKQLNDGKVERVYRGGIHAISYTNQTMVVIYPNKYQIVYFQNGDTKQTWADGTEHYYYAQNGTLNCVYPNGLETFLFSNGQKEMHYPDGTKEIEFPDHTIKCTNPILGDVFLN